MEAKSEVKPMGAAMEGDGFYNRNSAMQAAGIARLLPYWTGVLMNVPLDGKPITIADYASSQGRNSMAPMRVAIDELRARGSVSTPITVVHTDLPTNDFVALFTALNDEPNSYLNDTENVYFSAIGRSYFHPLFPAGTVLLGWNTWSMHWMSGEPINAPDQVLPLLSQSTAVREALRARQAKDWETFLRCRAHELKPGGRLLTAFTARRDGLTGWDYLGRHLWGAVCDLADAGYLSGEECEQLTVSAASRSREHILEPFGKDNSFHGLSVEQLDILTVPDPHWETFSASGEATQFGLNHANGIRAWAGPDLLARLGQRGDAMVVIEKLFARIAERVADDPQQHTPYLAVVILAKS